MLRCASEDSLVLYGDYAAKLGDRSFGSQVLRIMKERVIFATKGARVGIGSRDMVIGDELVALFYCPTPYIIREKGGDEGTWEFVGEAYVHRLIYGQALDMLDRGGRGEVFHLEMNDAWRAS